VSRSFLQTSRTGAPDGAPFLVFHDRYQDLEDSEALGQSLSGDITRIAVRSPRAQAAGGSGLTKGYFWYIGPLERPELSTLGDGLYQLEVLVGETFERYGKRRIGLFGAGEGGILAILAGLIFPDMVRAVIATDAPFPANFDLMPIETRDLDGLPVLLGGNNAAETQAILATRGAKVTLAGAGVNSTLIAQFLAANA